MRVSTRIILGFRRVLFRSVTAGVYQISIICKMQAINQNLSDVNFEAATSVKNIDQDIIDLEDYSLKYFSLGGDPLYERELGNIGDQFKVHLAEIDINAHRSEERQAIKIGR